MNTKLPSDSLHEMDHFGDSGVIERVILNLILANLWTERLKTSGP
jgi:hypothetical protein